MKKLVFLLLLFITSLSFGQAIDSSKWIKNDGSFNYNNWKVRNNLIIPTKTDTTNKISGLTQIIGTDLYFVATDHKWKTYISDTSGMHTQLVNQLAAIQANASSITGKQSQLNGNGFVKATGTTISYDNTSYFPATGGVLSGTAGNGYVGFTPQSSVPTVPSSGFKLFASSAGAFSWLTTQGYMRELRIRNQNQDFIGYFQNKPSYTIGDSADIAGKENALTFSAPLNRTGNTVGVDTVTSVTGLVTKGFLASQNYSSGSSIPTSLQVSSATSLALSFSTDYIFSGTSSTWTLPSVDPAKTGRNFMITVKNRGTGNIIINSDTGSTIYDASAISTLTVYPGEAFTFMPGGTYFNVE